MAGKQRLVKMFVDVVLVTDQNSEMVDFRLVDKISLMSENT